MFKVLVPCFVVVALTSNAAFAAPQISLAMTVGDETYFQDPQTLPTATSYAALPGETITIGYEVTNLGDVTLQRHDLDDTDVGEILNDFPFTLVPGASAFILQTYVIAGANVFTGTWTARNSTTNQSATATDSVRVRIADASITLTMTVGDSTHFDDPQVRPTATTYNATPGETITIGYQIENTGEATLTRHDLDDSVIGNILNDFPFTLVPGATAFILQRTTVDETMTFSATWTANITGGGLPAPASDHLTVFVAGSHDGIQSADRDSDNAISLSELLRVVQFYNSSGYHCADVPGDTEDGYLPGAGANQACTAHDTDYNAQDWAVSLTELLRLLQFYNTGGYYYCPADNTEDSYCPGL